MNTQTKGLRTWIEVNKSALKNNYAVFRKLIKPDCKLMAIAKSNAYGHGLVQYAETMQELGADWIGVDSITEASRLRKEGIALPILVLGYTLPDNFAEAADNNISLTISSFESLEALKRFFANAQNDKKKMETEGCKLKIHLKIDTGMHRQGFQGAEVEKVCKLIQEINNYSSNEVRSSQPLASNNKITVEGIYTHFAAAKDPDYPAETEKQLEQFREAVKTVESFGFRPIRHAAATGGTIVFPESHFDLVRIGIGLMGLWPSSETRRAFEDKFTLSPALEWKTVVSEINEIPAGERIGYDFTEVLSRPSKIAILPIGYWHGYRRDLSGVSLVLINGRKAKVLGRVSMDMIVVDVTEIGDTKVGDEVILLGKSGNEEISAYDLAKLSNTSWYETITQINPLIKKIYV